MTSYVRAPLNFAAHQRATVGDQKISFTVFDHLGWMKCDGRAVSRVTYALLFNVIGTTFGAGDGSTTFNLPNYSGCVPGMAGQPPFTPLSNPLTYARGAFGGEQQHQLNIDEMPAHTHGSANVTGNTNGNGLTGLAGGHTHGITDPSHNHGVTDPGHTHSYVNQQNDQNTDNAFGTETAADQVDLNQTTGSSSTGVTVNNNITGITVNPVADHQHSIGSTGGSQYHNNMQPTLFGGNMYIFSGRMSTTRASTGGVATYPYAQGTDLA